MASLSVSLWSVWLFVVVSRASALAHNAMGDQYELPCGVGPINDNNNNKILNGSDASPGEYPFMVNLRYPVDGQSSHLCGGVIINASYILTARHCLWHIDANELEVFVGDHDQSLVGDGERKILIEPPILHAMVEKEREDDFWNDIALIKTKEPMQFYLNYGNGNGSVNRICMPYGDDEEDVLAGDLVGFGAVTAGWGRTYANDTGPATTLLQQLSMDVIECPVRRPINWFRKQICTMSPWPMTGIRQGDSGGPLFWVSPQGRAYLLGLSSQRSLRTDELAGFVDVRLHLDWIKKNM